MKKVTNNRQIMYECDRGYKLDDDGPPGATCVAGRWSPKQLPRCVPEQHSRGRWARSIKSGRAPVGASIRQGSKKSTGKGTRRKQKGRFSDIEDEDHGEFVLLPDAQVFLSSRIQVIPSQIASILVGSLLAI